MITTTPGGGMFSRAALSPPPLLIQKKTRRATFRRRILRKPTPSQDSDQYVFGPLDDIIDVIKSDIWESPPDYSFDSSILDWTSPLKAPPTWTVTPLPVSRAPSDHPLTIRKSRNSRSSASGSSFGDLMAYSRSNSQDEPMNGGQVGSPPTTALSPWPLFDTTSCDPAPAPDSSGFTIGAEYSTAQQALENVIYSAGGRSEVPKRRASRLRIFTNGFPRLRRTGTGDTSGSTGDTSETPSPAAAASLATQDETAESLEVNEPSDEAVEAYIRKNARNVSKFGSIMERIAKRLPPPAEFEREASNAHISSATTELPTTLRAAVRVFPEVKILTKDVQEFSVAVDIEGVLHNRKPLPDTSIDVIFVVDNGYYVTDACLDKALDAVNGALYHLGRGDRLALYTTHCTHHAVTGNRPDMHYPIRPFCTDTEETFRELTSRIAQFGTQVWDPPRPNPSMTAVILGIAKSTASEHLKPGRTHVVVLSPAAHVLHDVSTHFPDLYIHRINPATLPYRRDPEIQDTVCSDSCCKNVFASNWSKYQSIPGRIKRILKNARSERPVGALTTLSLDIRTRPGCELIKTYGSKDVPYLYEGQLHTFFVRVRVTKAATQHVDLESRNPVLNSSLGVKDLRQELQNAVALQAMKVHLFDVQVYHQNSLHTVDSWNYTETPLIVIRKLGGLAPPLNTSLEVFKRQYFYKLTQVTTEAAKAEGQNILTALADNNEQARRLIERMVKEIECHRVIEEYEQQYRQKLPLCPGPIQIEASDHEWLVDLWNRKKIKRKGVAVVKEEDITGLTNGINRMERLG
ncbi:hypothetical protein EJ02DRAFT_423145 [Clathrospora elynae]|uniref:Uncharacterized protein n=1 Tax=Clathrospora elynae TaxID=706981 RepID=A0A6A5SNT3_9PLEO|nr:hypothetical protein EJ02DRAFT_423145 [Clathrospora elynae]